MCCVVHHRLPGYGSIFSLCISSGWSVVCQRHVLGINRLFMLIVFNKFVVTFHFAIAIVYLYVVMFVLNSINVFFMISCSEIWRLGFDRLLCAQKSTVVTIELLHQRKNRAISPYLNIFMTLFLKWNEFCSFRIHGNGKRFLQFQVSIFSWLYLFSAYLLVVGN